MENEVFCKEAILFKRWEKRRLKTWKKKNRWKLFKAGRLRKGVKCRDEEEVSRFHSQIYFTVRQNTHTHTAQGSAHTHIVFQLREKSVINL